MRFKQSGEKSRKPGRRLESVPKRIGAGLRQGLHGGLYSEGHRRKFKTEEAGSQVVKDTKDKSRLALAINGQLIGEWFKEQFDKFRQSHSIQSSLKDNHFKIKI